MVGLSPLSMISPSWERKLRAYPSASLLNGLSDIRVSTYARIAERASVEGISKRLVAAAGPRPVIAVFWSSVSGPSGSSSAIYLIQESIPCGRRKLVITCGRWSRRRKLNRLRSFRRHRNNYRKREEGKQYVENARHLLLTHTLLRSTYSIPLVRQHKWRPFPLIP